MLVNTLLLLATCPISLNCSVTQEQRGALTQCCFNDGPHFQRSGDVETVLFQCITLITFGILYQTSPNLQGSRRNGCEWCVQKYMWSVYLRRWTRIHVKRGGGPRVVVSTAAFHARVRGSVPGIGGLKETKLFLPHPRVKVSIVGSLRDREVACSASDRQGSNFESCVWRTVSSQSSHHPQEVLLAQFSLYVHKGGLNRDSFYMWSDWELTEISIKNATARLVQCWLSVLH